MKISRLSDRFVIKLEGITVTVGPLSGRQKIEMTSLIKQDKSGKLYIDKAAQEHYLIKHSVKAIEGLKDLDDNSYELEFEGECLSDVCAEELLSFLVNTYFTVANIQIVNGMMGEVINPVTGAVIEGIFVERVLKVSEEEKKSP